GHTAGAQNRSRATVHRGYRATWFGRSFDFTVSVTVEQTPDAGPRTCGAGGSAPTAATTSQDQRVDLDRANGRFRRICRLISGRLAALSARKGSRRGASAGKDGPPPNLASFLGPLMSFGRIRLSVAAARRHSVFALAGLGYEAEEAAIIADHAIDAALCGYEYSGLAKLLNIAEHRRFKLPRRKMSILRETPVSTQFDGGNNVGMLAIYHAACHAIE